MNYKAITVRLRLMIGDYGLLRLFTSLIPGDEAALINLLWADTDLPGEVQSDPRWTPVLGLEGSGQHMTVRLSANLVALMAIRNGAPWVDLTQEIPRYIRTAIRLTRRPYKAPDETALTGPSTAGDAGVLAGASFVDNAGGDFVPVPRALLLQLIDLERRHPPASQMAPRKDPDPAVPSLEVGAGVDEPRPVGVLGGVELGEGEHPSRVRAVLPKKGSLARDVLLFMLANGADGSSIEVCSLTLFLRIWRANPVLSAASIDAALTHIVNAYQTEGVPAYVRRTGIQWYQLVLPLDGNLALTLSVDVDVTAAITAMRTP